MPVCCCRETATCLGVVAERHNQTRIQGDHELSRHVSYLKFKLWLEIHTENHGFTYWSKYSDGPNKRGWSWPTCLDLLVQLIQKHHSLSGLQLSQRTAHKPGKLPETQDVPSERRNINNTTHFSQKARKCYQTWEECLEDVSEGESMSETASGMFFRRSTHVGSRWETVVFEIFRAAERRGECKDSLRRFQQVG